jgi:branched-chain amino acid transport system permease protein
MRSFTFFLVAAFVGLLVFIALRHFNNDYYFFAGYVVVQFIVLATAWNILGGYCGYVNFGSAAFFAAGAYSSVALHKFDPTKWMPSIFGLEIPLNFLAPLFPLPIPVLIVFGGAVSGLIGFGMGYLTLRLRGAFFAIATLALAVVLQTLIINWDFVGGARGAYIIRPAGVPIFGSYIHYLFLLMLSLAVIAVGTARMIERSRLGYGFACIRDDELAAEASGVPTLKLKLIATTISGALMGMAGAPFPYYIGYVEPGTAFGLAYAVNSIAMPMIGGTTSWIGPLVGAILLGTVQQVATVTISSAVNLLIVGILLVDFVIIAPNGIVGLIRDRRAGSTIFEPTVFVLLYVVNLLPMLFLAVQGPGAQYIALAFWAILIFVAYARGRMIGRVWLMVFPLIGAGLSFGLATNVIPDASTIALIGSLVIQVFAIVCGLIFERRARMSSSS